MDPTQTTDTEAFFRAAAKALVQVARTKRTLTADDIWDAIPAGARPAEPRILGGFMLEAAKQGSIKATRGTRRSARRRSYTRVWKSLIFEK